MDPHPFARPPERALIHNPNHGPLPGFAPPTSQPQPPVHVPFSADPYPTARRDPFLPPTAQQHARRRSYGIPGGEGGQSDRERHGGWGNTASPHPHPQPGPPPPPPSMSSSHNTPGPSPYGYDTSRRRSLSGASPPNPYGAPSHDAPPPPPSFARPHMPPPSSPQQQQQQHNHASQAQRPPFPSTFGRELPGLGPHHRPGSSMSISSLIGGGDTGASNQPSQSHSSPNNTSVNTLPPNSHGMQPPSPRRGLSSGPRQDFPLFRRQPSPDRQLYTGGNSRAPEGHNFPAGSPTRPYSNQGSPEQARQSLPQTAQPYKPMVFQGTRPYASSPNDTHARDPRQSLSNVPPRPNSQPTGPHHPPDQEAKTTYDGLGGRRSVYGQTEERRRTLGESHHTRPNVADILGVSTQPLTDRERPVTVHPVSHSLFSPPRDHRGALGPNPPSRNLWRSSGPEDPPRETTEVRREEPPALYRGYGGYSPASQGPAPYANQGAEDMVRGRSLDHLSNRVVEQYHAPPTSDPHSAGRQKAEQLSRSLSSGGGAYTSRNLYDQPRRMGEEMQHSKSLLGLGSEANRRGRASPLPQAVQGAQGQPLSIGKDPSIKSEFGRMFSGLGSGLGASTPSRGSPMPQNGQENLPAGADLNEVLRLQRVNSQNGRKPKRVKDEEGIFDNEDGDGRGTPLVAGGRSAKRNKPSHHHHHHAHAHHHHHHHHKPDEEVSYVASASSAPFNARYPNPSQNSGGSQGPHHHHHYHAAPHHHHHAPRGGQAAPLPSPKISPKVHDIQAVLDEASKLPRKHLGSHLYEAMTELPKPNSSLDDQFGYASKPKPLPKFERNPVNCTFTVRVPRFHLKPRQRQQIVLQRHLWGARIYRDDSDPIAAAIHSGWIQGEWDDTVDVNMLDPRITATNDPSDAEDTLAKVPVAPVTPPADMDLQIDILMLPGLEEYTGSVEYGISSRKSKRHEGLSFMIQKMRWVEDGYGSRGQERTAAALKRRLDASATLLSLHHGGDHGPPRLSAGTAKLHA